ncbi:MAG TPA: hypothetical protein VFO69_12430 [Allosphingosinicella sp.]|nr:hypothetical protein [Allosphingosinicella sp.]
MGSTTVTQNPVVWIETGALLAALVLIPFYMGLIHVDPLGAMAYALVGGLLMAVGEELQFRFTLHGITLADIVLWAASIAGVGGVIYVLALIFI